MKTQESPSIKSLSPKALMLLEKTLSVKAKKIRDRIGVLHLQYSQVNDHLRAVMMERMARNGKPQ